MKRESLGCIEKRCIIAETVLGFRHTNRKLAKAVLFEPVETLLGLVRKFNIAAAIRLFNNRPEFFRNRRLSIVQGFEWSRILSHRNNFVGEVNTPLSTTAPRIAGNGSYPNRKAVLDQHLVIIEVIFGALVDGDKNLWTVILEVLNVPCQIGKSDVKISAALVLQRGDSGDQNDSVWTVAELRTKDVEELLGTQVSTKSRFGYGEISDS